MRNQVKPIRRLARAAESFGKGQEVRDFKPEGATEVRQAAAAFINMRNRIKRQIQQRTEMLAGVSHALRPPLTRLQPQLEMLEAVPEAQYPPAAAPATEHTVAGSMALPRGSGRHEPDPPTPPA